MNRNCNFSILSLLAFLLLTALGTALFSEQTPLIPRQVLFGNPVKAMARISPDGAKLAYLAPSKEGVLNVWVRTLGKDDDAMVTADTHRGIRVHYWTRDSQSMLYMQDFAGDENFHLYQVNLQNKVVRDLTPFQGIRAENLIFSKKHPNEVLVGLNLRDRSLFDMYRVNLTSGAVVLDTENPGDVLGWDVDDSFVICGATAMNPADGSTVLRIRDGQDKPWRDFIVWPFGESGNLISFSLDGKSAYVQSTMGSDTGRLLQLDLQSGKEVRVLFTDKRCDMDSFFVHPDSHEIQAVSVTYTKPEWHILDAKIAADFDLLQKKQPGYISVVSRDNADGKWVVAYEVDNGSLVYYLYDRSSKGMQFLFENYPELKKYTLASQQPVIISSRDGLKLVSYMTLPVGIPARNLPLVLLVHGGPWARDLWGYDPIGQMLANRGYLVLQVNFRGSTGLGKKFWNAGNLQWGVGGMQNDLTDAVRWAVKKGYADPKRVAIMGGSYGGYATLAGLTFTPELYACGVDIVGPSNIRTLFQSIPPYWAPFKRDFVLRVGDVEKDDALNQKISPLFHVDRIRAPLLIGQGANDPRVNIRESDQIVQAMRSRKLPVTYVVYTDEGHGFARPENNLDFFGYVDEFLSKHIGGRCEPYAKIAGSAGEVR